MEMSIQEINVPENNFKSSVPKSIDKTCKINNNCKNNNNCKIDKTCKNENVKNFKYNPYANINNKVYEKPSQIDYDKILKNMGMYQSGGKLYWDQEELKMQQVQELEQSQSKSQSKSQRIRFNDEGMNSNDMNKNSYIYNKYFKNEIKENNQINQPKNVNEYRNMLIQRILDRKRAELIKSRNMIFK
jgi:hypothetical protein